VCMHARVGVYYYITSDEHTYFNQPHRKLQQRAYRFEILDRNTIICYVENYNIILIKIIIDRRNVLSLRRYTLQMTAVLHTVLKTRNVGGSNPFY